MARVFAWAVLAIAAGSCRWLPGRGGDDGAACAPVERPRPPDHVAPAADFAKLRAYRNYYTVDAVDDRAHHFVVRSTCRERVVDRYAVDDAGGVRWLRGAIDRDRPHVPRAIPADQQARARAVEARHATDYRGARDRVIEYIGSHRELRVREIVPTTPPTDVAGLDAGEMQALGTIAILRADAGLTRIVGVEHMSMIGAACSKTPVYGDCSSPAWIDFEPETDIGHVQMGALVHPRSPLPFARRARFADAVVAAARRRAAGESGLAIDDVLARQDAGVLPPGFAPPLVASFAIYGRKKIRTKATARLDVAIAAAAVRTRVRATGTTRIAGVAFSAEFEIAPVQQLPADAAGEHTLDLRVTYRLRDDRGNTRDAVLDVVATALVDGDRAAIRAIRLPVVGSVHDEPVAQIFPGTSSLDEFDAYLEINPSAPWWPNRRGAWSPR